MLKLKNKGNEKINLEKKNYKLEKLKILPSSGIGKFFILCFIIFDSMFIYQIVEGYFTQSQVLSITTAAVIACLIDVSPSLAAGLLNDKQKKYMRYAVIVMIPVALVVTFVFLALIRIHSEDLIYQTMSNQITSLASTQEIQPSTHEQGKMWMSALFCIAPVFTSIVSFTIGLFDNPKGKKEYLNKINSIKNREKLIDLEADNLELELELQRQLHSVNDKYRALELDDIQNKKIIAKEIVKLKMAQVLKTPQALTNFMENSSGQ